MPKLHFIILGFLAGAIASAAITTLTTSAAKAPAIAAEAPVTAAEVLSRARSWSYQLQNYDLRRLAQSKADVLVVDYSFTGDETNRISARTLERLQKKPDGSRRLVLAYLSIGEAEEYRYYWKSDWIETAPPPDAADATVPGSGAIAPSNSGAEAAITPPAAAPPPAPATPEAAPAVTTEKTAKPQRWLSPSAPAWLGDENETWSGNFAVRYDNPDWQAIFLEGPNSYLARIVAAGFDGIYLDRVDAFYNHPDDIPDAAGQMVGFVQKIAATARALKPGFLIVPQNGEELLLRRDFVAVIDAIAKEDLLYGSPEQGQENSTGQIANSLGWLGEAKRAGRPVLVVEYLDDPQKIATARIELERMGFIATFAPRELHELSPHADPPETSKSEKQPARAGSRGRP